ncbi:hypothetical protein HN011_010007, partial [Eciton burchellii]
KPESRRRTVADDARDRNAPGSGTCSRSSRYRQRAPLSDFVEEKKREEQEEWKGNGREEGRIDGGSYDDLNRHRSSRKVSVLRPDKETTT